MNTDKHINLEAKHDFIYASSSMYMFTPLSHLWKDARRKEDLELLYYSTTRCHYMESSSKLHLLLESKTYDL